MKGCNRINSEVRDTNYRKLKEKDFSGAPKDAGLLVGHQRQARIWTIKRKDEGKPVQGSPGMCGGWRLDYCGRKKFVYRYNGV